MERRGSSLRSIFGLSALTCDNVFSLVVVAPRGGGRCSSFIYQTSNTHHSRRNANGWTIVFDSDPAIAICALGSRATNAQVHFGTDQHRPEQHRAYISRD